MTVLRLNLLCSPKLVEDYHLPVFRNFLRHKNRVVAATLVSVRGLGDTGSLKSRIFPFEITRLCVRSAVLMYVVEGSSDYPLWRKSMTDETEGAEPGNSDAETTDAEALENITNLWTDAPEMSRAAKEMIQFVRSSSALPSILRMVGEGKLSPRDANTYTVKLATRTMKRSLPRQESASLAKFQTAQKRVEDADKKLAAARAELDDATKKMQECSVELDALRVFIFLREVTLQALAGMGVEQKIDLFELLENIPDGGTPDFMKYELKSNNEVKAKFRELMQTREGRMQLREVILYGSDLFRNMAELYDMAVNKARGPM